MRALQEPCHYCGQPIRQHGTGRCAAAKRAWRTALPTGYSVEQALTPGTRYGYHYIVVDRRERRSVIIWHGAGLSPLDRTAARYIAAHATEEATSAEYEAGRATKHELQRACDATMNALRDYVLAGGDGVPELPK